MRVMDMGNPLKILEALVEHAEGICFYGNAKFKKKNFLVTLVLKINKCSVLLTRNFVLCTTQVRVTHRINFGPV
jgi:hypothetical protein